MIAKAKRIDVLPAAKRDIYRIWHDLALVNPSAADKVLERIDKRVVALREHPERGAPRDELMQGLRMLVEGKYLIFYIVKSGIVSILRVVHGSIDLHDLFT